MNSGSHVQHPKLPAWMNMWQATAWVIYRRVDVVLQASTSDGLAGVKFWGAANPGSSRIEDDCESCPQIARSSELAESLF